MTDQPYCQDHMRLAVELTAVRVASEQIAAEQTEMRADVTEIREGVSAIRADVAALKATTPAVPAGTWLAQVQRYWPVLLILATLAAVGLDLSGRQADAERLRQQISRVERLAAPTTVQPVRDGGTR
jgi:uncharacterized protein (UPF0335 family)